jgi:hypothetical protein
LTAGRRAIRWQAPALASVDTPITRPLESRIGEIVKETSTNEPSLRSHTV